jgi:hypothetical protein
MSEYPNLFKLPVFRHWELFLVDFLDDGFYIFVFGNELESHVGPDLGYGLEIVAPDKMRAMLIIHGRYIHC